MSIADELNHYAGGLEDAYDAAQDMGAVIPANRNMDNLDAAIRTIPQPSVNDGILTITQNGTTAGSFTANQASNTTVALTDTTYSNFTGTDGQTAGTAGLVPAPAAGDDAKVLSGAGTWVNQPTVNNGTLTIQQNGTTVDTFTANQSTNVTANIDTHNGVLTANDLSPTTDTVADWLALFNSTPGYYVTFYSGTTGFANQPATWGQLETFISAQTNDPTKFEVYQKWHTQSDGEEYYRAGNSAGWFNSATDSGKFYKSESNNSANSWHAFGVTSATAAWQTAILPGRITCDIKPNGQGGVHVRNISSNNAIRKARVIATTYFTSSQSGKNFGIGDLAASTVYTRYSGLIGSTAKTWSQATNTASSGNANLFSDTFAMTSVSIEYVAVLSRPSMNSWLIEGTISATGSASFIQFSTECTAGDATKIPLVYVRGVSSSDISDFNASIEFFV